MPTCYSPVRRSLWAETLRSLDLHVLGAPPAFVLSQDQTLQLNLIPVFASKSASTADPNASKFIHVCPHTSCRLAIQTSRNDLVPDQLPALSKTGGLLLASPRPVNNFFHLTSLFFPTSKNASQKAEISETEGAGSRHGRQRLGHHKPYRGRRLLSRSRSTASRAQSHDERQPASGR